ncbi:MAG: helix-turn-helix domain containing protein [Paracoccaceae bacterium]|nr:helix-turn-helix domain containing protein [Paracoccaceae bacterium]
MSSFENETYAAIANAVALEEGRLSPKKRLAVFAAVECFAENGYEGTSTKMIADRAGIAEATIFRHFGTKRQLLMRIASPVVKHLLAPAVSQEAQALQVQHQGNLKEIARAILKSRLTFLRLYEPLVKILLQEVLVNEDLRLMIINQVAPVVQNASGEIMASSGQSVPEHERVMRSIVSLLLGYFFHRAFLQPEREWDDNGEVDYLISLIFHGIQFSQNEKRP